DIPRRGFRADAGQRAVVSELTAATNCHSLPGRLAILRQNPPCPAWETGCGYIGSTLPGISHDGVSTPSSTWISIRVLEPDARARSNSDLNAPSDSTRQLR